MSVCPACQSGQLEPYGGKTLCSNPRCFYSETCSDGGCMVGTDLLDSHPFQECPDCHNLINTLAIEHHCPNPHASDGKPSSTAESDYASVRDDVKKPDGEGKEITVCKYCHKENHWHFAPAGFEWLCSICNHVNPKIDHIIFDQIPSRPIVTNDYSMVSVIEVPVRQTIYLSGPMTGHEDMNKNLFDQYAELYQRQGFDVINPADNIDQTISYEEHMRRDIRSLTTNGLSGIYLLPGWQTSKGAQLEVHLAKVLGIPLFDAETGQPYRETIVEEAHRLVYGDRRDTYKNPLDDFGRTAGILNAVFQHKLNQPLTAQDVALIMIAVKLSRLTNKPDHRDSCVDIAGYAECYWWCGELLNERENAV